eukprot:2148735-Pyramimonas_sp.AAC.1
MARQQYGKTERSSPLVSVYTYIHVTSEHVKLQACSRQILTLQRDKYHEVGCMDSTIRSTVKELMRDSRHT